MEQIAKSWAQDSHDLRVGHRKRGSDANKEGWGVLHALVCVELLSWFTQDSGLMKSAFYCPVDVTQFQFFGVFIVQ